MNRNTRFKYFISDYIGAGLIISIVIITLCILGGLAGNNYDIDSIRNEKNFYTALQKNLEELSKAPKEESKIDKEIRKSAIIIKVMAKNDTSLTNFFNIINRLEKNNYNFCSDLVYKQGSLILKIARGEASSDVIKVNIPSWSEFWKWVLYLSYICIILATTINFLIILLDNHESIFAWPWQKFWVYPTILFISPGLVPCFVIGALRRLLVVVYHRLFHLVQLILPSLRLQLTAQEKKLRDKKVSAIERIKEVQSRIEETKKNWVDYYLVDLRNRKNDLKNQVETKKNYLSGLGQTIKKTQLSLAQTQKELDLWDKEFPIEINKKTESIFNEFERLLKLPCVVAVDIINKELRIYTDILYINYGLSKYEIGMFRLDIGMYDGYLHPNNLSSTNPNGNYHPYGNNGGFCWGKLGSSLFSALNQKEFAVAVAIALQALQSAEGDRPSTVQQWKEV